MLEALIGPTKIDLLPLLIDQYKASLLFVTETWLKPGTPDAFLGIQRLFSTVRQDRQHSEGGGVCAFIRKDLNYNVVPIGDKYNNLEIVVVDVMSSDRKIRYIVCYRPPYYDDYAKKYVRDMIECFNCVVKCSWPCILVGDFNLPLINWKDLSYPSSNVYLEFMDFVITNGFTQIVDGATRGNNILDLVLCNAPMLINDCIIEAPIGDSDHNTVCFNICDCKGAEDITEPSIVVKDFKAADYVALNNYLAAVNWQDILVNFHDVQDMWGVFTSILDDAIEMFVPTRVVKVDRHTDLRCYPKYIRRYFSQRLSAWRIYRRFHTESLRLKYYAISRKCERAVEEFHKRKENTLIDSGSIGDFYRFINNKTSNRTGVAALKGDNGEFITNDSCKAEKLNNFFSSVFTVDNNVLPIFAAITANTDNKDVMDDVDFSIDDVYKVLRQLKPKFSAGPDGYNAFFLKNVAWPIAFPLSLLFSQSFCNGDIPAIWRQAIVTPSFKKGNPSDPNNYRPISLTCICCKVMESVVKKHMLDFLLLHGKISKQQHGFLAKHSTCSQLTECVNDWSVHLNVRNQVDIVYIDFCKAFDSVVHSKLIYKLESMGIRGKLLAWIAAFLSDRSQVVRIGRSVSGRVNVISGVPQGSVLGPLLFLVYINDIVEIFDDKVTVKMFADDVKIYVVIDNISDCVLLQKSLEKLQVWASDWQLQVSITKCAVLQMGVRKINYQYNINDIILPTVDSIRDLGIIVCKNLKFNKHVDNIVARAHQRASLILRCFKSRDTTTLCRAFVVYVRPLVEYCSQIWSPSYLSDIYKIERVQRRFTRRLKGMNSLSYGQRLNKLKLETLELRRLKFDLLFVFKILNGLVSVSREVFNFSAMLNLRGHNCKLVKPISHVNCRLHVFVSRIVDAWNVLPQNAINATNVNVFKSVVNDVNFNKFLQVST